MNNRSENVSRVIEELENDMELLGVTGVEDHLQDDVRITIEKLKNAGISIWMLTGDKIETSKCIAISCGLKTFNQDFFVIEGNDIKQNEIKEFLNNNKSIIKKSVLVLDGVTLEKCIDNCKNVFFDVASKASSVIICRCSPIQKAIVTENVKKLSKKVVCAVGDGGNDVGMILTADVGIGLLGLEGKQASLVSDFSIGQFK